MRGFAYFISSRFAKASQGDSARPEGVSLLLRLAVLGVAMSLLIVLLSLSIIQGFKQEVRSVAYSQTGQVSLYSWGASWQSMHTPMTASPRMLTWLGDRPEVEELFPLIQQMGILKTEDDFLAQLVYGVDSLYGYSYFDEALIEGAMPSFSSRDSIANPIVLPSKVSERMGLSLGDKVRLYYYGDKVRVRSYQLAGIYDSHGMEQLPALCSAEGLRRLLGWADDSYSRVLIQLGSGMAGDTFAEGLIPQLSERTDLIGHNSYSISTAEEMMPELFQWLTLLDSNVVFLIVMMLLVGAFTMITGLIIVVLDKIQQIGILKALGASDAQIRRVFVLVASRLILSGLLWGNALALLLLFAQKQWKLIPLDPQNYFMDAVPVVIDPSVWIGVNVGAFALILLSILAPTYIITQIKPADIMRID